MCGTLPTSDVADIYPVALNAHLGLNVAFLDAF